MATRDRVLCGVMVAMVLGILGPQAEAAGSNQLFLVDSQFSAPVTRIYKVNPATGVLELKANLGTAYTPVFGMAAADARTFYLIGTDSSPSNLCNPLAACLLLRVVLDPGSPTPSLLEVIGVLTEDGQVAADFTGLTFRQDGQLYGISQATDSLYTIDPSTAVATRIGGAGLDLYGGDLTFDQEDRLWAWTNFDGGEGLYQIDPDTGLATPYEIHPFLDFSGLAALGHGNVLHGPSAPSDRLYALDLAVGLDGGVLMTLGGVRFDHIRGDADSPYCDDDAFCFDDSLCTIDSCAPGGCRYQPVPVSDGDPCTQDSCLPSVGPVHTPDPSDPDMDGVPECRDSCPGTAGGVNVGLDGCPFYQPFPKSGGVIRPRQR